METSGGDYFADPLFLFCTLQFLSLSSVIINAEDFDQTLSAFQLNCVKSLEASEHKGRTKMKDSGKKFTLKNIRMIK